MKVLSLLLPVFVVVCSNDARRGVGAFSPSLPTSSRWSTRNIRRRFKGDILVPTKAIHPAASTTVTGTGTSTSLSMANEVMGKDRILSCLPYLLPLLEGDSYGRYIFRAFPPLGLADALLLGPFHLIYETIPFSGLIFFFGLSILSRNADISRSVRFNMQQAVILDIGLIFPSLLGQLIGLGGGSFLPRVLVESGNNFIFYCLVASVGYSLFSNATGKLPNGIPIVSEAAETQIGPF